MYFVAKTRLTGQTMVITIPSQVKIRPNEAYQFSVEPIKKEVDDGKRD